MRRRYFLNNREISPCDVDGFLHRAKSDRGECEACGKNIKAGKEYIRFNYYDGGNFHKDCYVNDHEKSIFVTNQNVRFYMGTKELWLICKEFGGAAVGR